MCDWRQAAVISLLTLFGVFIGAWLTSKFYGDR